MIYTSTNLTGYRRCFIPWFPVIFIPSLGSVGNVTVEGMNPNKKNIILMDLKTSIIDLRRYWY